LNKAKGYVKENEKGKNWTTFGQKECRTKLKPQSMTHFLSFLKCRSISRASGGWWRDTTEGDLGGSGRGTG